MQQKTSIAVDTLVAAVADRNDDQRCADAQAGLLMILDGVSELQDVCHGLARKSGWWKEYDEMPEQYRKYFIGTKLALVHSEASEALEGVRKNMMDDHLPHRPMGEVEAADVIIRLMDLAGAMGWDVAGAVIEKLAYNQQRPDHKPEARQAAQGKSM